MTKGLVERLSSQTLLTALMRLSNREGAAGVVFMRHDDPDRPARIAMIRAELARRLTLQRDLSLEAEHIVTHVEVLVQERPELADPMTHSLSRLRELAKTPFGNYEG